MSSSFATTSPFRWIAPVRAWQLVAWEAAALGTSLSLGRTEPTVIGAAAAAGALVGATSIRFHGRCLSQWAETRLRYHTRPRPGSAGSPGHPLMALLPDLRLAEHVDRAGNRVGLAAYDGGWTAAVRLAATAQPELGPLTELLRRAYHDNAVPLASAQLVVWTTAGPPRPGVNPYGGVPEPLRVHWLAVRYRPRDAPHAALARGGGAAGAMRATASAVLGLTARLEEAGHQSAVLDREALGQELMVALGAPADAATTPALHTIGETWKDWSIGPVRQVCYLPDSAVDPARVLHRWAPGAAFTCASYTLARTARGQVREETVVRIGGRGSGLGTGSSAPRAFLGVHADPANGRHRRHVLRTLPLGVEPR